MGPDNGDRGRAGRSLCHVRPQFVHFNSIKKFKSIVEPDKTIGGWPEGAGVSAFGLNDLESVAAESTAESTSDLQLESAAAAVCIAVK